MDRFEASLAFMLKWEGGVFDDPKVAGRADTNRGVTQPVYDYWRSRRRLSPKPVTAITEEEVRAVYRDLYWDAGRCGELPVPLDLAHFDACVNLGLGQAPRLLQAALGVKVDGAVGPATLAAAGAGDPKALARVLVGARIGYYVCRTKEDRQARPFLTGWLNRCHDLLRTIG